MYKIKLQKYNKGKPGSTRYWFSNGILARYFAMGYKAALLDTNNPEYLISIFYNEKPVYNDVDISQGIDWITKGTSNSLYGRYVNATYESSLSGNKHETE